MRVVYAYEGYGCRSQFLNDIVKYLFDWQIEKGIRLEIVYISTHDNDADGPSREINIDNEMCVTPQFFHQIQQRFRITFTLDACASQGTQITTLYGRGIPYCSQLVDECNSYLNFFNLPFSTLLDEKLWIFAPRNQEAAFLDYFLAQRQRPEAVVILLQHQEAPTLINLLHRQCVEFQVFRGRGFFRKPFAKRCCFVPYHGRLVVHCFRLPKLCLQG